MTVSISSINSSASITGTLEVGACTTALAPGDFDRDQLANLIVTDATSHH